MHQYDPRSFQPLTFHDKCAGFANGYETPRAYLESCLHTVAEREPAVHAFVALNPQGARTMADASTERWKLGQPLSAIDGMPVGIKDLLETKDMPTQMGKQHGRRGCECECECCETRSILVIGPACFISQC